jgi:hypothetical protein
MPVMISRSGRCPWRTSRWRPSSVSLSRGVSAWPKRRHGLARCRYEGLVGMNRWVALGVIAKNIVNIGRAMEKQTAA